MILQVPPIENPVITGLAHRDPSETPNLFGQIISNVIGIILVVAALWAFAQLIIGGIRWISSSGDKGKLEIAQKQITNALIGLFIVFAFWAIYIVILQVLGMSGPGPGFQIKLPTLL